MILFIDCEYNGWGGALISMALVPLDPCAPTFYEVVQPPPCTAIDPWVEANVLPHIDAAQLTREQFAKKLAHYLARFPAVHLVADWPEDVELFCRHLITGPGTRIGTPPLTMEVRRDIGTEASAVPHHALHDAMALRRSWQLTQAVVASRP